MCLCKVCFIVAYIAFHAVKTNAPFLNSTQAIVVACLNIAALIASYFSTALIVGRCIQGLGVGILSVMVPIYQYEIAPGHGRGLFVYRISMSQCRLCVIDYAFYIPHENFWCGPYIIQACLVITLVIRTFLLPEMPRWLIKNGFQHQGIPTLADPHARGDINPLVANSYTGIQAAITLESHIGEATWGHLFTQYIRRVVVGITCQLFAQFNGINGILYFPPENLTRAGFTVLRSFLYASACALIYCAGMIPTMFFVDTSEKAVDWECGVGVRVGAHWRTVVSCGHITRGPCKDTDCQWDVYWFLVLSILESCFIRLTLNPSIVKGVWIYLFIFGVTYVYLFSLPLSNKLLTVLSTLDGDPSHGSSALRASPSAPAQNSWHYPPPSTGYPTSSSHS